MHRNADDADDAAIIIASIDCIHCRHPLNAAR
jgi:hypothetical protein